MQEAPGQGSSQLPNKGFSSAWVCSWAEVPTSAHWCFISFNNCGLEFMGKVEGMGSGLILLLSSKLCIFHTGKEVADRWYSEIKNYNFQQPGFTSGTGE